MSKVWIDQAAIRQNLSKFFQEKKDDFTKFGRTVNQTFEAFVFVSVVQWYASRGWEIEVVNAKQEEGTQEFVRLKFSTRGRPDNYTYFICKKGDVEVHIRHQLRVATRSYVEKAGYPPANICLDVAVIKASDLSSHKSNDFVINESLVTFGEAKHMSAFAELIASFIGLVHELGPQQLKKHKKRPAKEERIHLAPFLYVSGALNWTALGLKKTIEDRGYDIDIYNHTESLIETNRVPVMKPLRAKKRPSKFKPRRGNQTF